MLPHSKLGLSALFLLILLTSCQAPERPTETLPDPGTLSPTYEQAVPTTEITSTPTPSQTAPESTEEICPDRVGEIQPYQILWQDEVLSGRIYTPPCYPEGDRSYPVLYLLHGATETEEQWEDLGLYEIADDLITSGEIPPLLIVMPREDTWIALRENPFADQLVQVVVPWVDKEYQTLAERNYRAVGGVSRGGNWAIRLGLMHWGAFGSLGGHSAPLFYGDLNRLPGWLEDIPGGSIPRIFLDIAEGDTNLAESEALRDILEKAGVPLEWRLYPGLHNGDYWSSHMAEYLLWYSAGWTTP